MVKMTKQKEEVVKKIDEFLEIWKKEVRKYYEYCYEVYNEKRKKLRDKSNYFSNSKVYESSSVFMSIKKNELSLESFAEKHKYDIDKLKDEMISYTEDSELVSKLRADKLIYDNGTLPLSEYLVEIDNYLVNQAEIRRNMFIKRIEELGGDILRLIDLDIDVNSLLNGTVSCLKGDVRIQTISAGGYNIQCYHYRVKQTLLKNRVNKNIEADLEAFHKLPTEYKLKDKTKEEQKEDIVLETIQKKIDSLEPKKFIENDSRGVTIYKRLTEFGYDVLLKDYPKLETKPYPTYILPYKDNRKLYWSMGHAHLVDKELDVKDVVKLIWNLDSTDSIDRVVNVTMKHLPFFKELEPIFVKRKKQVPYGYKEEPKEEKNILSTTDDKILKDHEKYVAMYENKPELYKYLNDTALELHVKHKGRESKVWKRMVENNLDKQLIDLGFKELMKTAFYTVFYRVDVDGVYELITPSLRCFAYNKEDFESLVVRTIYMKDEGHTMKDIQKIALRNKEDKSYEVMVNAMNLRAKPTPYVPKQKEISKNDVIKQNIMNIIKNEILNNNHLQRSIKIINRMKEMNYYKLYENKYNAKILAIRNQIPIIYYEEKETELTIIITPQQYIELNTKENKIVRRFNMMDNSVRVEDLLHYAKSISNAGLITFAVSNDLRKKPQPYIPNK